jgi:hypothetical protein
MALGDTDMYNSLICVWKLHCCLISGSVGCFPLIDDSFMIWFIFASLQICSTIFRHLTAATTKRDDCAKL